MGRLKEYSQDYRRKIICMYQESGLTTYRFCQLPDVSVSVATVKRWLRIHQESRTLVNKAAKTPSPHVDLNIACYSLSNDVEKLVNEEQEKAVTLEEMIKFQRDVHDCCLHLYQMRCSKKEYLSSLSNIGGTVMALPFEMDLTDKKVFLRVGASDFRRGLRGMVSLVVGAMNLKMDEKSLFVFCSTSKKQIRIVYTEGAGIWMCTRRIRYGRYPWPMNAKAASQLTVQELKDLLADPVPLEYLRASGKVSRMELHV